MKKVLGTLATLLSSLVINAQTTITHNNSQAVVPNIGITCAQTTTGITHDNRYFGVFDLATDFGIVDDWQIDTVQIAVQSASNLLSSHFPIHINAYTTDDGTPNGILTFLGGDFLLISTSDQLSVVGMALPASVIVPAGEILLIEIEVFGDGQSVFRLGATNIASNDESWGQASSCGFPVPITYTDAGFLDVWNILNVIGDVPTGIENTLANAISIFPNPTEGILNVDLPATVEILSSSVFDIMGSEIEIPLSNGTMDTSALPRGTYFLLVQTSEGDIRKTIVKK